MKKAMAIIIAVFLIIFLSIFLTECSLMYGRKTLEEENLHFYTHNIFRTAFAGDFEWNSDSNYAVLTIPDTCEGYVITTLGGYVGSGGPCPFLINLPDVEYVYSAGALPENAQIEQYHLVINIGKNLKRVKFVVMDDYYYRTASGQFVQVLVTVNCSEDNLYFYSENGKLYRRLDDSLVEGFFLLFRLCEGLNRGL